MAGHAKTVLTLNASTMFGLFKSAKEKTAEANFELVAKCIKEFAAQNVAGIEHAESSFNEAQRRSVARGIFLGPIDFDRSTIGLAEMQNRIQKIDAEFRIQNKNLRAEYGFGLGLSYRMIAAGSLLTRVDDSYWMQLVGLMAHIEGPLLGFMERYNVQVWPVHYALDFEFEAFRTEFRNQES